MTYSLPLAQFQSQVAAHPDSPYLHQPEDRQWRTLTWAEIDLQARKIAAGLQAQGYEPGSRIAILSKNCAEWFIADIAILMAGMISVPIYSTAGEETIRHVLSHSGAKAIFVGKLDSLDAAENSVEGVLRIAFPYPTITADDTWQAWLDRYEPVTELPTAEAGDVMSIVYTSGSTGLPKGVTLTHLNIASSADTTADIFDTREGDCAMSYLPLAHITERCCVEWASIYSKFSEIYFVESLDTFMDDLRYARPTHFISVPRLWTKYQAQILANIPNKKLQFLLKIPFVGKATAAKIRTGMGLDRSRIWGSGSAPISPGILEWFETIGVNISEGWGMTETSGLSCSNMPYTSSGIGTIGKPVACVNIKLSDEGEILISGDAVFKEYYNNPEATAEVFTDGWFHTGDRGELTPEGNYKIIGRVKDQFKTGKGKYVAPVPIEGMLARNPMIDQVCLMGSGRKQPIAVVVLNDQAKDDPEAKDKLEETLHEVNGELEGHQKIDNIVITEEVWSVENELLTATLKIKRRELEQKFAGLLTAKIPATVSYERDVA